MALSFSFQKYEEVKNFIFFDEIFTNQSKITDAKMRYKKYIIQKNIRHQQSELDVDQRFLRIDRPRPENAAHCFFHFI